MLWLRGVVFLPGLSGFAIIAAVVMALVSISPVQVVVARWYDGSRLSFYPAIEEEQVPFSDLQRVQ